MSGTDEAGAPEPPGDRGDGSTERPGITEEAPTVDSIAPGNVLEAIADEGTADELGGATSRAAIAARIRTVLAGETPLDTMSAVARALADTPKTPAPDLRVAFGLDANVILDLHKWPDAADYLASRHQGLLILPSQAVQEFWNNKSKIQSISAKVKGQYETLATTISNLDAEHLAFKEDFDAALAAFEKSAGHLWAPDFRAKVAGTFAALAARAREPRFPKPLLADIAQERQLTRTPPGFKDSGSGDLYVWAEFLLGLLEGQADGLEFDLAVLVTEDKKSDWGKGGEAHPVLIAELAALAGVPFETWDFKQLNAFAASATT